jgi:nucleoside-diphosphate-sugar epimerase
MNTRSAPKRADLTLVTGATGWLGARLVESLVRGLPDVPELAEPAGYSEVRCLVYAGAETAALDALPSVACVAGDLTNPESLRPFVEGAADSTLFHCAGVIHPKRAAEFEAVNTLGTQHLLDAAAHAGVRRFVHVSSNSPFGANRTREDLFDEESPYNPYMGYGRSKMAAEQAVWEANETGGMEIVIVRAPWFYGPGQPARQTQFFTMIRRGSFPLLGDGGNRRSMAYIDNLCHGLMLCERSDDARGRAFWIADERPYSMNEIVDTVEKVMERDFHLDVSHRRTRVPSLVSDVARVGDRMLQAIGLYDQRVHVLSEMNMTIACSIEKARQRLGYQPMIALEEGMRRSLTWVMSRGITI